MRRVQSVKVAIEGKARPDHRKQCFSHDAPLRRGGVKVASKLTAARSSAALFCTVNAFPVDFDSGIVDDRDE